MARAKKKPKAKEEPIHVEAKVDGECDKVLAALNIANVLSKCFADGYKFTEPDYDQALRDLIKFYDSAPLELITKEL